MRETVDALFARAGQQLGYSAREIEDLQRPAAIDRYDIKDGNGSTNPAFRVRHRIYRHGSQGGLRVVSFNGRVPTQHKVVDDAIALGGMMSVKLGLTDEQRGGAKSELLVPEETYKDTQRFRRIVLADFVLQHIDPVRLEKDGVGPDMKLASADMDYMAGVAADVVEAPYLRASYTGKSIMPGREDATSQGMVYALERAIGDGAEGKRIAVQGAGNVGQNFARLALEQLGVRVMAISDRDQALVARDIDSRHPIGLAPDVNVRFGEKSIAGYDDRVAAQLRHPDDLLELDNLDMLVLAGPGNVITKAKGNQHKIKAPWILEGANGALDADTIITYSAEGRRVFPGVLYNLGGVAISCLERDAGLGGTLTEAAVRAHLRRVMHTATDRVVGEADGDLSALSDAAYRFGGRRIYERDQEQLAA